MLSRYNILLLFYYQNDENIKVSEKSDTDQVQTTSSDNIQISEDAQQSETDKLSEISENVKTSETDKLSEMSDKSNFLELRTFIKIIYSAMSELFSKDSCYLCFVAVDMFYLNVLNNFDRHKKLTKDDVDCLLEQVITSINTSVKCVYPKRQHKLNSILVYMIKDVIPMLKEEFDFDNLTINKTKTYCIEPMLSVSFVRAYNSKEKLSELYFKLFSKDDVYKAETSKIKLDLSKGPFFKSTLSQVID